MPSEVSDVRLEFEMRLMRYNPEPRQQEIILRLCRDMPEETMADILECMRVFDGAAAIEKLQETIAEELRRLDGPWWKRLLQRIYGL